MELVKKLFWGFSAGKEERPGFKPRQSGHNLSPIHIYSMLLWQWALQKDKAFCEREGVSSCHWQESRHLPKGRVARNDQDHALNAFPKSSPWTMGFLIGSWGLLAWHHFSDSRIHLFLLENHSLTLFSIVVTQARPIRENSATFTHLLEKRIYSFFCWYSWMLRCTLGIALGHPCHHLERVSLEGKQSWEVERQKFVDIVGAPGSSPAWILIFFSFRWGAKIIPLHLC